MLKTIIFTLLLSLSPLSYASCTSLIDSASKTLGYPEIKSGFSDCKVHPVDSSKTIVAFARIQGTNSSDSTDLYNLDVLLVDTKSGKILQHLFQEGAFESDAAAFSGITIDTARYKLAPELRAFGIRASFDSNSHMYALHRQTLNLYMSKDQKMKQVLVDLITLEYADSGETLDHISIENDGCTFTKGESKRTLAIAKTAHHGYADLLVQEKTTNNESKLVKNVCVAATTKMTKKYTLQFNGDVYVVPDKLTY